MSSHRPNDFWHEGKNHIVLATLARPCGIILMPQGKPSPPHKGRFLAHGVVSRSHDLPLERGGVGGVPFTDSFSFCSQCMTPLTPFPPLSPLMEERGKGSFTRAGFLVSSWYRGANAQAEGRQREERAFSYGSEKTYTCKGKGDGGQSGKSVEPSLAKHRNTKRPQATSSFPHRPKWSLLSFSAFAETAQFRLLWLSQLHFLGISLHPLTRLQLRPAFEALLL